MLWSRVWTPTRCRVCCQVVTVNTRTVRWVSIVNARSQREQPNARPRHGSSEYDDESYRSSLSTQQSSGRLPTLSTSEKVKQAGKDTFYGVFVVGGIAVTCLMGYAIFRELFSSSSAGGVYADAVKYCKKNVKVQAILGEPIKAYGELGSRGRRKHVRSAEFEDGSSRIVQIKFHLSGPFGTATVYAEKDVTKGEYRTLIFETDDKRERFRVLDPPSSTGIFAI